MVLFYLINNLLISPNGVYLHPKSVTHSVTNELQYGGKAKLIISFITTK